MDFYSCVSVTDKPLFSGSVPRTSGLQIQFHLEAGHMCYFYYESTMARDHFAVAEKLSQLSVQLTGYCSSCFRGCLLFWIVCFNIESVGSDIVVERVLT